MIHILYKDEQADFDNLIIQWTFTKKGSIFMYDLIKDMKMEVIILAKHKYEKHNLTLNSSCTTYLICLKQKALVTELVSQKTEADN